MTIYIKSMDLDPVNLAYMLLICKCAGGNMSNLTRKMSLRNFKYCKEFFILLLWVMTLSGCVDVNLVPQKVKGLSIPSKGSFCIVDPIEVNGSTKIMFIVDVSESNSDTDPDGSKRANNIDKFVTEAQKDPYQYGLIVFDDSPEAVINYNGNKGQPRFTDDPDEIYQATQTIRRNPSRGYTVYGLALTMAKQAIKDDIRLFPDERSTYIILFISDGEPSDSDPNSEISSLVNIDNREIYLSTAYYGNHGNNAINLLQNMAKEGGGNFVNFENDENWDFNQLIIENDVIPWNLKRFLVYNLNAGFCLDGRVDVDSDADGMCDRDEIAMNDLYAEKLRAEGKSFDPANRFSFGDGYGDFFHWLRFRNPGKSLPSCEDRSDEDFDLLTKCEENEIENQSNSDDVPTRGDPKVFDTDRDGIIDGIETYVYFASENTGQTTRYTAALDKENLEDNPDGEESVLVQIQQHRNPWFQDPEAEAYDTSLIPLLNNPTKVCYMFSQSVLPVYQTLEVKKGNTLPGLDHLAGENSVMVYYIQVLQPNPDDVGVLKHSVQRINRSPLSPGLQVTDGIFDEYIPPK